MRNRASMGGTIVAVFLLGSGTVTALARPPAHKAHSYTVVIDRMQFGAMPAGLRVGDSILWVNRDLFRHTATATDRSFDIDLPPGKSAKTTLRKAGTIAVSCKFHPGMKARLILTK